MGNQPFYIRFKVFEGFIAIVFSYIPASKKVTAFDALLNNEYLDMGYNKWYNSS